MNFLDVTVADSLRLLYLYNYRTGSFLRRLTVDEMVNEVQRTALDREFQPLHAWGEAAGPRSTLRQMLLERAGKYLQERVTNDGKTYTGTYDIDKQPTRAQWLARQAVDASFKAEVQAEVAKIVAEMQTRIRAAVGAAVAAVVTEKIR